MESKNDAKSRRRSNALRLVVLVGILAGLTVFGILHQFSDGWRPAGVDALCPFGGVESLVTVLAAGRYLERVASSSFVLLAATLVTAAVFRRSFCGVICPLGTLQELAGRLGKRILRRRFTIPGTIDGPARRLKYVVLAAVVVFSVALGELVFRPYDPWVAFQHLTSAELFTDFAVGFTILALALLGSFFFDRVFCKYLCPLGGFLGIACRAGYFRIRRNAGTCIDCGACNRVCPVNIPVQTSRDVTTSECLNCGLCVNACPVPDTLTVSGPRGGRISANLVLAATVLIFAVTVAGSTIFDGVAWTIKGLEDRAVVAGVFNADEIKGSDKFADVSRLSGVPKEAFVGKFGLSEAEFAGALRDWAHKPGSAFDVQNVRDFVREMMRK